MTLSPFSLSHEWSLHWKRIPSNRTAKWLGESEKEKIALEALTAVGVIGGVQLSRLFRLDKNRKKHMVKNGKLVRHSVQKNKQVIPVYTLGPIGAKMISLSEYEENYWVTYDVSSVLKRLLFFQLFGLFPKATIYPALSPFTGSIRYNGQMYHVYVARDDVQDLLRTLKWQSTLERMILITEKLEFLIPLNAYASDLKMRVVLDQDLRANFKDLFYMWQNQWVKENVRVTQSRGGDIDGRSSNQ